MSRVLLAAKGVSRRSYATNRSIVRTMIWKIKQRGQPSDECTGIDEILNLIKYDSCWWGRSPA